MKQPKKNPHAVELGRLGGQVKSEAKTRAARLNATKPRGAKKNQVIHIPAGEHSIADLRALFAGATKSKPRGVAKARAERGAV